MNTKSEIIEYLLNEVEEICNVSHLSTDTELLEGSYLNSMTILYLVSEIEEKYEIEIPIEKIVADSFHSVESMAELIASLVV